MCSICSIENKAEINLFDDSEIDRVISGVFLGTISVEALDYQTYKKVAEKLTEGVFNGFGTSLDHVNFGTPDYLMLNDLRTNVYIFSGAKQYQQVRAMTDLLTDGDRIKGYNEFKTDAKKIFANYNENYLSTEYNSAIAQARSASMWMEIEKNKEVIPNLTYVTAGDGRVRPEHAQLDGIVRPVDDKFWNLYFPPNGWNCRCRTTQTDDKVTLKKDLPKDIKNVPDVFLMNPGKDRIVFSNNHPYYSVAPKDLALAKRNFDLPLPAEAKKSPVIPEKEKIDLIPDEFKKREIKLDDKVYELLGKKLEVRDTKQGSHADPNGKYIGINFGERRFKISPHYQKAIIYHEIGHVVHYDKKLIHFGKEVSKEYKDHFNELKEFIKGKGLEIEEKLKKVAKHAWAGTTEEKTALIEKYGVKNVEDAQNMITASMDGLMALTNSRYGAGHTKKYMSILGAKEAEVFAHSMENYFVGNPIFKEVMPEVYEETKKFIEKLLK